jgi:hypothetical protein
VACDVLETNVMPSLTARLPWAALLAITLTAWPALAQTETFTAIAEIKSPGGESATVPLTIAVARYATSKERQDLIGAMKEGGATSAHALLLKRAAVGTLQINGQQTPIRYAYAVDTGGSRLITLATAEPIPIPIANMRQERGYDVGFLLLELDSSGSGTGQLVPAAKVHVDAEDAIVTEHASPDIVQLSKVTRK